MTTYYVGGGGNDANAGTSWALRKLTLNGAEDIPVVADDLIWVAANKVYRERLTVDVDGGAGTEIVYVGDVTGEHTDGLGGVVRVTGSDNDIAAVRNHCITADTKDHRVFRGFSFDMASSHLLDLDTGCEDWDIEDCVFGSSIGQGIQIDDTALNINMRRCLFFGVRADSIAIIDGATQDNTGHVIENCQFIGGSYGVDISRIGGVTIRNCLFYGQKDYGVRVSTALAVGQTTTINNCIFTLCDTAVRSTAVAYITENFNTFFGNGADRNTVNVGVNSQVYPPLFLSPTLNSGAGQASGFQFSWWMGELGPWSQIRAIAGSNEPGEDFYGIRRPATASKNSWGPIQYHDMEAETGTVQAGTYARVLHDAGSVLVKRIPITGVQITVTLYVRREANYAGNLPRMIIKQPGQADQITAMTAAVNTWEQLTDTFTPASPPGFVELWIESRNTAVAGNYETFYDTMDVTL